MVVSSPTGPTAMPKSERADGLAVDVGTTRIKWALQRGGERGAEYAVFNPQMADQALKMIDLMDFKDKEKIIQLQPGIIFSSALEQEAISAEFNKLGFRVESFYPTSLTELYAGIARLGEITGTQARASVLTDSLKQILEAVTQEASTRSIPGA